MGKIDAFATVIAAHLPAVADRIPPTPAATLGRLGPTPEPTTTAAEALRRLGPLLAERVLGALELRLADLPTHSHGLVRAPAPVTGAFAVVGTGGDSETSTAVTMLDALRPGVAHEIATLVDRLRHHPALSAHFDPRALTADVDKAAAPSPHPSPEARAESALAARHATPHLALALVTAHAVLHELDAATPAAVVGVALGVTALHLSRTPRPAALTEASRARHRADYRFPVVSHGHVPVRDHHFTLTEAEAGTPVAPDFSANGLVTTTPGGIAVRTAADHPVDVQLSVLTGPPDEDLEWWDEVVELSWRAERGDARIPGRPGRRQRHHAATPPWPGDYRVRVHARGRDGNDAEAYHLAVWEAPPAPEHVIKRLDTTEPPHAAHRWVERSPISDAATVTVITGSTVDRVLAAFDATGTASLRDLLLGHDPRPWVAVHEVDGTVVTVEHNGYRGANAQVLAALSEHGRAASMFWNVNAVTKLSFAERGRLLAAFEPWATHHVPDAIADLVADLHGARHKKARGLTAVARFTGRGFTPDDLRAIEEAAVAHLIGR
ncbi:DUF6461 domain-containing protein [Saccharothrix sp. S26]|uniref:DUF6461 domain-containing protein n=1 Tax=Saccharothrix sp. S26 TaxID=2907215 RepID=UPI001F2A4D91|nr:DUF6461 domain-containing protein [Saccharothrix sp. S26]MCE6994128.1 DUF6461 domain-containing protein [Saccharothrix sp. S26]